MSLLTQSSDSLRDRETKFQLNKNIIFIHSLTFFKTQKGGQCCSESLQINPDLRISRKDKFTILPTLIIIFFYSHLLYFTVNH